MKKYEYDKNLISFLMITFLLPLISLLLQAIINNYSIKFVLYGIEAASPTIAVIVILCVNNNIKNFFMENFNTKYLARALILPIFIICATMFSAKVIACAIYKNQFVFGNISLSHLVIILWAFIAEEFGWRGYLQPFLKSHLKQCWLVPFAVGVIWCFWHYHYFFINGMHMPFMLFLAGCIIESYIYDYLLNWTGGNLLSAMMYHFSWNFFLHLFAINPIDNNGNLLPYGILTILELLNLLIFFLINKVRRICPSDNFQIKREGLK